MQQHPSSSWDRIEGVSGFWMELNLSLESCLNVDRYVRFVRRSGSGRSIGGNTSSFITIEYYSCLLLDWLFCSVRSIDITLVTVLIDSFGYLLWLVLSLCKIVNFLVGFFSCLWCLLAYYFQRSPSSHPWFLCETSKNSMKDNMIPARYFHWSTECFCRSSTVCRKR